jgi:membrane fusion protein (multidrug efflux system)
MKKTFAIFVVLIALGIGMGLNEVLHYRASEDSKNRSPSVSVTAVTLQSKDITLIEEFPGRASAYKIAEIRPQVGGIIVEQLFIEGSNVKQGQQLYQIDPAPYQAAYKIAKAGLAKAKAAYMPVKAKAIRYKELIKVKAISQQDYDDAIASLVQADADIESANATLNTAEIDLKYTKVYAPIDGVIGKSSLTVGALVSANQATALATVTQLDPIYIDATKPSEEIYNLRQSFKKQNLQSIKLFLQNANSPYTHEGTLQFSDVVVDPSTSSVALRFLFPNPEGEILPGMFVRTKINITSGLQILVPQQATTRNSDGTLSVWKVKDKNKVKQVVIKVDRALGNAWLVSEGLKANDQVIMEGIQKLKPDSLVEVSDYISSDKQHEVK